MNNKRATNQETAIDFLELDQKRQKKNYKRISEADFGREMLLWDYKGTYPLEAVSVMVFKDDKGEFYAPCINDYCSGEQMITGNGDGYETREQMMRCVGRCWDKALAKRVKLS